MGRELKRVPLDFAAPMGKTWSGYVCPHYRRCPDCKGGQTPARQWLHAVVYLLMMAADDIRDQMRGQPMHPWLANMPTAPNERPSEDILDLTAGLGERESSVLGHDCWSAEKKVLAAAGLPERWGTCKTCGGDAIDPAARDEYEKWRRTEPPKGDGYQLWETTSEGSPISPVFSTLDSLCEWCADGATVFGSLRASAAEWKKKLSGGLFVHEEGGVAFI